MVAPTRLICARARGENRGDVEMKQLRNLLVVTLSVVLLASCTWRGSQDIPLPFTKGSGRDAYTITAHMRDVANLVPHAEVRMHDVVVGTVRSIEFDNWVAEVKLGLEPEVQVPENVTIKVAQNSLLGAEYIELAVPAEPGPALTPGAVVPIAATGNYPETEDVLAGVSLLLNGGALHRLHTITSELNAAFAGNEVEVKNLIKRFNRFLGTLDEQRGQLVDTLDRMNNLAEVLAGQTDTVAEAMRAIPQAEQMLLRQEDLLMHTLKSAAMMADVSTEVMDTNRDMLAENLTHLTPALRKLADAGSELPLALGFITLPIALEPVKNLIRGDYINIFLNLDLTLDNLGKAWTTGGFGGISSRSARATMKGREGAAVDEPMSLELMDQLIPPLTPTGNRPADATSPKPAGKQTNKRANKRADKRPPQSARTTADKQTGAPEPTGAASAAPSDADDSAGRTRSSLLQLLLGGGR